jgi:hypothetical protein
MMKTSILIVLFLLFIDLTPSSTKEKVFVVYRYEEINFKALLDTLIKNRYISPKVVNSCSKNTLETILRYNYQLDSINFALNLAKIYKESSFNINAVSGADCWGLHQISEILCKDKGINFEIAKTDWEVNSKLGVLFMQELLSKYDVGGALTCYNKGETGFKNDNYRVGSYAKSILKVEKIFNKYIKDSKITVIKCNIMKY